MQAQLLFSASTPLIAVDAAVYDGTNDVQRRGGDATGAADSKTGIFSCFFRPDATGTLRILDTVVIAGSATVRFLVQILSGQITIGGINPTGTQVLNIGSTSTGYVEGTGWHHILSSWDLAAGVSHLYVNDVSDQTVFGAPVNSVIDYTVAAGGGEWGIAGVAIGVGTEFQGGLAELFFAPGQYLDFSLVANRRKFISASKKPVYLGSDGSFPLGVVPIIYQHLADAESVANFATNRGSGGDFPLTGTLVTDSTSPSD